MQVKSFLSAALVIIGVQSQAFASVIEESDGLELIDVNKTSIYFTESFSDGRGRYTVTNNVANSYLVGFGVTNYNTQAWMEDGGELSSTGFGGNNHTTWMYDAKTLTADNWDSEYISYLGVNFASDLFGDADSFFQNGENTLNWYASNDGALLGGMTWDKFVFTGNQPASMLYALIQSEEDEQVYAVRAITPENVVVTSVSEPGMIAMFSLVLAGLIRRRMK